MTAKIIETLQAHKNKDAPLVCLTAYSTSMATSIAPHVDVILVGDSLGMVLYGMDSTRGVTLEMMINHGQAVMRGRARSDAAPCIIVDMPFNTYETSPAQALETAQRVMDETGCDGVKLEGGADMAPTIAHLTAQGIPVMAHIGLMPQAVEDGKFRIQGRDEEQISQLHKDAKAVEDAGAFSVVIEGTVEAVAADLTRMLSIPTIGIGASISCDGQILVSEDVLGLLHGHTPKFVKQYAGLKNDIDEAVKTYAAEVRSRTFPTQKETYQ